MFSPEGWLTVLFPKNELFSLKTSKNRENLVLDPLAILHIDNQLFMNDIFDAIKMLPDHFLASGILSWKEELNNPNVLIQPRRRRRWSDYFGLLCLQNKIKASPTYYIGIVQTRIISTRFCKNISIEEPYHLATLNSQISSGNPHHKNSIQKSYHHLF